MAGALAAPGSVSPECGYEDRRDHQRGRGKVYSGRQHAADAEEHSRPDDCDTCASVQERVMDATASDLAQWQTVFAGLVALFTLCYVVINGFQLRAMRKALAQTRRSNEATEKSNQVAERHSELGSRAWLFVSIRTILNNNRILAGYDIEVSNLGKTPAQEAEVRYQIENLESAVIPDEILASKNQRREAGIVIGPNATHVISYRLDAEDALWSEDGAARSVARQFPLVFYCVTTYRDIFGKPRKTVACRKSEIRTADLGGQEWAFVPEHNWLE
jgi:hypothetical protein